MSSAERKRRARSLKQQAGKRELAGVWIDEANFTFAQSISDAGGVDFSEAVNRIFVAAKNSPSFVTGT
jgi:hypothetical protein